MNISVYLTLQTYFRHYFISYHDRSPVSMQCTPTVSYPRWASVCLTWEQKRSRLAGRSRLECGLNYNNNTSEKRFLRICSCLDKCTTISSISTQWLGHTVQQGSTSRDYSLQCDRPSYLLRVMRGRFSHSALAQSHMARSTYWACCWLWNQLLTWFTMWDCFTTQTSFFFFPLGSRINFRLDWQTVPEGGWALHATTRLL